MVIKATAMHVPPTFYFGTFLSRALHDYDCQATDVKTPNATFEPGIQLHENLPTFNKVGYFSRGKIKLAMKERKLIFC